MMMFDKVNKNSVSQGGWAVLLAFLALCPDTHRDWLCVGVLCALQCAKNSVGSCLYGEQLLVCISCRSGQFVLSS